MIDGHGIALWHYHDQGRGYPLASVGVNNTIVLIDYTNRLHKRGMHFRDAIIAAEYTQLRLVLLTVSTNILELLSTVAGIAFNFHEMEIAWISESSQW